MNNQCCAMCLMLSLVEALRTCLVSARMQAIATSFPVLCISHMREPHSTKLQMPCLAAGQDLVCMMQVQLKHGRCDLPSFQLSKQPITCSLVVELENHGSVSANLKVQLKLGDAVAVQPHEQVIQCSVGQEVALPLTVSFYLQSCLCACWLSKQLLYSCAGSTACKAHISYSAIFAHCRKSIMCAVQA